MLVTRLQTMENDQGSQEQEPQNFVSTFAGQFVQHENDMSNIKALLQKMQEEQEDKERIQAEIAEKYEEEKKELADKLDEKEHNAQLDPAQLQLIETLMGRVKSMEFQLGKAEAEVAVNRNNISTIVKDRESKYTESIEGRTPCNKIVEPPTLVLNATSSFTLQKSHRSHKAVAFQDENYSGDDQVKEMKDLRQNSMKQFGDKSGVGEHLAVFKNQPSVEELNTDSESSDSEVINEEEYEENSYRQRSSRKKKDKKKKSKKHKASKSDSSSSSSSSKSSSKSSSSSSSESGSVKGQFGAQHEDWARGIMEDLRDEWKEEDEKKYCKRVDCQQ